MQVIGISGLDKSVAFKQKHFPEISSQFYRIAQGLDSAAALVDDDHIVAAVAEERFSRTKGTGNFPLHAIEYCLQAGQVKAQDIDYIAHCFAYEPHEEAYQNNRYSQLLYNEVLSPSALRQCFEKYCGHYHWEDKVISVPHHLAHAASTFYPSGFNESLILVSDGMGEKDSAMIAIGTPKGLEILKTIPSLHSIGILYSLFTLYLGFDFNFDEYKVMGLAPYGNAQRYFIQIMELVTLKDDGTYTIPVLFANQTDYERETYSRSLMLLEERFGPARKKNEKLRQHHKDIAAALQSVLQTCLLHLLRHYQRLTDLKQLCMAGGVALNCSANGVIQRSGLFNKIFVQPAAGDDGAALGAALWLKHQKLKDAKTQAMSLPLWGPEYSNDTIALALEHYPDLYVKYYKSTELLLKDTAEEIMQGHIIGWFQGRAEFGPRALGNRSILADPVKAEMRDKINALIKQREDFRPFAPAVMAEHATTYFDLNPKTINTYNAMLFVAQVKREHRAQLAAVTHVDGSARVQTVLEQQSPMFWALIDAYRQLSGIPILLNTSFNVRGQPMVCSPTDAIETFITAGLDSLVIGNYRVTRMKSKMRENNLE